MHLGRFARMTIGRLPHKSEACRLFAVMGSIDETYVSTEN